MTTKQVTNTPGTWIVAPLPTANSVSEARKPSTVAHTPGPWKVDIWNYSHANPPRKELNIQNGTNLIATLQCDHVGGNPYTIAKNEAEANAALIAAAPELLLACKGLLEHCGNLIADTENDDAWRTMKYVEFAKEAITKATS